MYFCGDIDICCSPYGTLNGDNWNLNGLNWPPISKEGVRWLMHPFPKEEMSRLPFKGIGRKLQDVSL